MTDKEAMKLALVIEQFDNNNESLPLELLKPIAQTLRALAQEKALQALQALEALESADWYIDQLEMLVYSSVDDDGTHENRAKVQVAITAIKAALALPAYTKEDIDRAFSAGIAEGEKMVIEAQPPQPEQEPVAWRAPAWSSVHGKYGYRDFNDPLRDINGTFSRHNEPLYTAPPQRPWVGLTDEEIKEFDTWHDNREEKVGWVNPSEIVTYIETKLKEKNT
jgi:hypothetical protein